MLTKKDLHKYQLQAEKHIIDTPKCGLFLDMGLGKTVSALTAIECLIYQELEVGRVLVIAPKRVVESVWHTEAKNWGHLTHIKITRVLGSPSQRVAALEKKSDVYVISRDIVKWLSSYKYEFDMLVIDESSSFKNPKSQRFKALKKMQFNRVVELTGTPSPNSLVDLWSQIYLLDEGKRLEKSITRFRRIYFTPGASSGHIVYNWSLKRGGEKIIHQKIRDICLSMSAKDYLDLPKRINNYIGIDMPGELVKKYKDFAKEQVLEIIGGGPIIASNAAVLSGKLLQFASGAVYDEEGDVKHIHDLKLDATEEIIEGTGDNILIAWNFKHERDRLLKRLEKYKPKELKGNKDIQDWNNGKIRILMMHPASGGHGLNLQKGGHTIVWFSATWSLEFYEQLNARLDRQGQKNAVIVHHLSVNGTIDERVKKSLSNKSTGQQALMNAVKNIVKKSFEK